MGFRDVTKPNRNNTLTIEHDDIPHQLNLTQAGYVRVPGRVGFLFQNLSDDPLPKLFGYLIQRFAKTMIPSIPTVDLDSLFKSHPDLISLLANSPQLQKEIMARTGIKDAKAEFYQSQGLTQKQAKWLDTATKHGGWTIDPKTGLVDVINFKAESPNSLGFRGVKFGKAIGDFILTNAGLTSLAGAPKKVEGTLDVMYNKLESLEGGPEEVGEDYNCRMNPLVSLKGAPKKIGGDFYCGAFRSPWNIPALLDIFSGNGNGYIYDRKKSKELVLPFMEPEVLDSYFKSNPLDLDLLDEYPEMKQGVIQRTGLPDVSGAAHLLRSGLF